MEVVMDTIIKFVVIGYFISMIGVCIYAMWFLRTILKDLEIEVRSE